MISADLAVAEAAAVKLTVEERLKAPDSYPVSSFVNVELARVPKSVVTPELALALTVKTPPFSK